MYTLTTRLRYAPPVDDYVPRALFRVHRGRVFTLHVLSADEERSARDHGWTDDAPNVGAAAPRRLTDDERLSGRR
jgi:hypothetical protein